ncbi:MAG: serpin family protein, partial [Lentimicrobiaceae bacterium]|nr:serpin family protein [Lentimicrobiaceae bacterium]
MKIKKAILFLGSLLFAIFMSGCNAMNNDSAAIEIILEAPEEQIQEMTATARGANEFAFRLSAALAQNIGNESFVFSPYSVWLPLAALVNATDDANREVLIEVLAESGISEADINRAASRMLYNLTRANQESSPLKIANAIFVDDSLTLRRDFADIFMSYYIGTA